MDNNVITTYSNDHYKSHPVGGVATGTWTDGVSVTCENTIVEKNQVVDTGDVGIVLYHSTGKPDAARPQASIVRNNTVLSAGVSMYGGIIADPLYFTPGKETHQVFGFQGSKLTGNTLWTSPSTHFVIGIGAGTREWFAGHQHVGAHSGAGTEIANNTTGSLSARVRTGIAVTGMLNTTVGPTSTKWVHGVPGKAGNPCPDVDFAASVKAGTAKGLKTALPYKDVTFDGCV